ncbi:MAG: hypothetical protein NC098_00650 [Lachnoclostridium sp.]|nr:hypothetical protein [Lachnoclostridium sp.]
MSRIWAGNNRASWHDYTSRCIYHFTLLKHPDCPSFGKLMGDCHLPIGSRGSSYVIATDVGRAIKDSLRQISNIHPALHLFQYALMPDHLHMILSVEKQIDETVGRKLGAFKVAVNKRSRHDQVFERGFNDQILVKSRKLDVIYDYLRSNPYRLAVRHACPDFFTRRNNLNIAGTPVQLYGNIHLLNNPFKEQVIVHRADNDAVYSSNKDRWLYTAGNGGVLVSPFISEREKKVRRESELLGGRFILITNTPFGEREKPSGKDFDLCAEGRMLIIAMQSPLDFSRIACLQMNSLANHIASPLFGANAPKLM